MPELDTDLFQWVTLALLGLTLLVLLLALLTLGRIRRAVERSVAVTESWGDRANASPQPTRQEPAPEEPSHQEDRRTESEETATSPAVRIERIQASEVTPGPTRHEAERAASTRPAEGERSDSPEGVLDTGAYLRAQSSRQAAAEQAAPATGQVPRAQEAAAETREQAAIPHQEEPEEQPFEREGRWWFRRDGELLVYDERTGQWGPASEHHAAPTVVSPAGTQGPSVSHQEADVTTAIPVQRPATSSEEQPAGASTFWKCQSCGAINAGEASSCRMCFTPKGLG